MSQYQIVAALQQAVALQAPVIGVSVGTFGQSATVKMQFVGATAQQIANAQTVVDAWDWSDAAQAARVTAANADLANARDAAQAALDNNATYLAIVSPTQAQAVAQVKALTQQSNQIIRALKLLAVAALG